MEAAPLTTAHSLARAASQSKTALDAVDKHKAAAEEYSRASNGVDDVEALRILKLLEDYHNRLASLVKPPAVSIITASYDSPTLPSSTDDGRHMLAPTGTISTPQPVAAPTTRPRSPVSYRTPRRELASSIATDLASARGIPNAQQRRPRNLSPIRQGQSSQRNTAASSSVAGQVASLSNARNDHRGDVGAKATTEEPKVESTAVDASSADDAFNKFYTTFGGLLSKLSAPLAFAGLPLSPGEMIQHDQVLPERVKSTSPEASHTDVEKIFSKAAMRAVKEDNGPMAGYKGIQESFFVVPAGGGTVSYANILSRTDRQVPGSTQRNATHLPADDESGDHFVDASETPHPTSPRSMRRSSTRSKKTMEELEIENSALKQLTENLNDRLYEWEKNAQKQTSALQQSIRSLQSHQSYGGRARESGISETHNAGEEEIKQLQEQHEATLREMERYARENEKLKVVVMRYRERWEKLKEGARVRREGGSRGTDTPQSDNA